MVSIHRLLQCKYADEYLANLVYLACLDVKTTVHLTDKKKSFSLLRQLTTKNPPKEITTTFTLNSITNLELYT